MAAFLDSPEGLGDRPRVVLAEFSFGPELLYRTRHAVIGTPYHRNVDGVVDGYLIFNQPFDAPERALVDRRGIDLILQCRAHDGRYVPVDGDGSFYDHLLAGKYPQWLRPLRLPTELAADYRLYEVLR